MTVQNHQNKNIPFLRLLKFAPFLHPVIRLIYKRPSPLLKKEVMGLSFSSPVGVAAGTDRRGEYSDVISCFSPGFVEIGPLRDVRFAIQNLTQRKDDIVVLANLSNTQNLVHAFSLIYDFADAIVLNVSKGSSVSAVIDHLLELRRYNDAYKPILFKIFPDLMTDQLDSVTTFMLGSGIDGAIVGAEFVERVREKTLGLIPIIATAEISVPERAAQILDSGADLIAVTNSPVHYGPKLIKRINKHLEKR